jgi:RNA polymerase sigma-70 factor (ECF subfamily)
MAADFTLDPDTCLMLMVREGDAPSFEALLGRHRTSVVNHLFRTVQNRAVAEELAQDVFVRVYRSRARYEPTAKFTTWLYRITMNVALNWRRDSRWRNAEMPIDAEGLHLRDHAVAPDELIERRRLAAEVRRAVDALPDKQLAAVLMHKYEGLDYAQIAEVLNCSTPALKSLLFRAYENLRRRLAHLDWRRI